MSNRSVLNNEQVLPKAKWSSLHVCFFGFGPYVEVSEKRSFKIEWKPLDTVWFWNNDWCALPLKIPMELANGEANRWSASQNEP